MPITHAQVMALTKPGKYLVGKPGLYAVVVTAQRRHWQFRYVRDGKDRVMSLGPIGPVTLAGAKDLHLKARTCWRTARTHWTNGARRRRR